MTHDADIPSDLPSPQKRGTVDRRTFVSLAIGAGFALAVRPTMAQSPVKTESQGLVTGFVTVPSAKGQVSAYRAMPQGARHVPIVLVVSEIFAVHEYIQDVCRRLAKLGYLAIAPEIFARHGDPRQLASIDEILKTIVSKTSDDEVLGDLDACEAWAANNGGDRTRLGITGFCFGGRITWLYSARNPRVKAAVAWYGKLVGAKDDLHPQQPIDIAPTLKTPVLGLYGGQDQGIPVDTVDSMQAALKATGNPSQIVIYDQAGHAFHADYRPSYRQADAEDGWKKLVAWFAEYLK